MLPLYVSITSINKRQITSSDYSMSVVQCKKNKLFLGGKKQVSNKYTVKFLLHCALSIKFESRYNILGVVTALLQWPVYPLFEINQLGRILRERSENNSLEDINMELKLLIFHI